MGRENLTLRWHEKVHWLKDVKEELVTTVLDTFTTPTNLASDLWRNLTSLFFWLKKPQPSQEIFTQILKTFLSMCSIAALFRLLTFYVQRQIFITVSFVLILGQLKVHNSDMYIYKTSNKYRFKKQKKVLNCTWVFTPCCVMNVLSIPVSVFCG